MPDNAKPVVWIYMGRDGQWARDLAGAIAEGGQAVLMGPAESGADLALDPPASLAEALVACPPELRPRAAVFLGPMGELPPGWDGLPCRLFCQGPGQAPPELVGLPDQAGEAARAVLAACDRPWRSPWLSRVQVNLPLRDLLGRYWPLASAHPVNLEVGLDALALDGLGPADLDRARELLSGRRVTAHLPFMDLSPGSLDPAIARASADRLHKAAQWAGELGALNAVMHLGYMKPLHRDLEAFAGRMASVLAPLSRQLGDLGCTLAAENVFEPGPEVLLAVAQHTARAGGRLGFCLDLGHALAFSRTGTAAWFDGLGQGILEMHLHDNDASDDLHLPPGRGKVDWELAAGKLAGLPQRPILTLEPHAEPDLWASLRAIERLWGPPPGPAL